MTDGWAGLFAAAFRQSRNGMVLVDAYREVRSETGRFTWWDYRAGNFHKNFGMRIDHLLVTPHVAERIVAAEIDRAARKGKPITPRSSSTSTTTVFRSTPAGKRPVSGLLPAAASSRSSAGSMSPQPPDSDWIVPPAPFSGRVNLESGGKTRTSPA